MLLSEMFGVERDTLFMVEGLVSVYKIGTDEQGIERIERVDDGASNGEVVYGPSAWRVINAAPSGIIHLPPPLTDEQRVVLMSLFTMGARYMGMSRDGWKRCFVNKPQKESSGWTCWDVECLTIASGMANCLDSLVSWSDPEPFDIGKALGVEE